MERREISHKFYSIKLYFHWSTKETKETND
jgi:hypothetical protein